MAGFFEPRGKVWRTDQIPRDFSFGTLDEDWEHLGPIFERAIHRVPALGECGLQLFFNGPESFTPDGVYYMGEAPEVDGCFVAAGFNSVGIQSAGGVGWALADWIAGPTPPNGPQLRRYTPCTAFPGRHRLSPREDFGKPWLALRHALAVQAVRERPGVSGCRRCMIGSRRLERCSAKLLVGNDPTGTPVRVKPLNTSTPTASRTGTTTWCRNASESGKPSAFSTRHRSPNSLLPDLMRWLCSTLSVSPISMHRSAKRSTHSGATKQAESKLT